MTWTWHALWHQIIINNISNCRLCLKIDKAHHLLWHLDVNNSINHQTRSTVAAYKQAACFIHTSSLHSSKVACLASKFGQHLTCTYVASTLHLRSKHRTCRWLLLTKNKRVCVASQHFTYMYDATTLHLPSKHIALAAWRTTILCKLYRS